MVIGCLALLLFTCVDIISNSHFISELFINGSIYMNPYSVIKTVPWLSWSSCKQNTVTANVILLIINHSNLTIITVQYVYCGFNHTICVLIECVLQIDGVFCSRREDTHPPLALPAIYGAVCFINVIPCIIYNCNLS